jgi:hypothetical protein
MDAFWITFRLEQNSTYQQRYANLQKHLKVLIAERLWEEPTSFVAFNSTYALNTIATHLEKSINTAVDVILLARVGYKAYRVIGNANDADVFKLFPEATEV